MTNHDLARLDALSEGFRNKYLDHAGLTVQLFAWADAFPDLVRIESLTQTEEGRDLWLLTIGRDPDRVRPAFWVDGNMHAGELAGSSTALAIAEDVIRLHLDPDGEHHGLSRGQKAALLGVLFHVCPRISPDGAEAVLKTGRYVRSVPRDERAARGHPRWVCRDIDGDGVALLMRVEDPTGEFVESRERPGLLVLREPDDEGPFYKVWPEGHIEHFDGVHVPDPEMLGDNAPDLNRNFPWTWRPEHHQKGAGRFPGSEPESRAVIEFAVAHRNLFGWINFHTFGGVFIRPLGDAPDNSMDKSDLALYRLLGEWAEQHTGYPMVSGFEEFTYSPETPIHGDLAEWAFAQLGCVSYVCEIWDLFHQIGKEKPKRFVDIYDHLTRDDMHALAAWDTDNNQGRVVRPWKRFEHPQLGPVDVGGLDIRVGMWNPPYERLPEVCRDQAAMALRVAALAPRLHVKADAQLVGPGATRVRLVVENRGYLPTHVLSSAKKLAFNEPVYAELSGEGVDVPDSARRVEIGHLDGWGRGRFDGTGALYFQRSRGTTGRRGVELLVHGHGKLTVRVGSCRMGFVEQTLDI